MIAAIPNSNFQIFKREAGHHTIGHRLLETFFNGWNKLLRDVATRHFALELKSLLLQWKRGKFELDVGERTPAAALLLVNFAMADGLGDFFFISDTRLAMVALHIELTLEAVEQDVEMKFAHTTDDGLSGLFIHAHRKGRVLIGQAVQGTHQFFFLVLSLRFHSNGDDRFGENDVFKDDRVFIVGDGVTGLDFLHTYEGDDVAGLHALQRQLFVGVHLEDFGHALAFFGLDIPDGGAGFQGT